MQYTTLAKAAVSSEEGREVGQGSVAGGVYDGGKSQAHTAENADMCRVRLHR